MSHRSPIIHNRETHSFTSFLKDLAYKNHSGLFYDLRRGSQNVNKKWNFVCKMSAI